MTRVPSKYLLGESLARVREVLMREWDPIGVQDIPEAADEYDGYVGRVHVMLMSEQASAETIAAYLFDIATNHMGLSNSVRLAELSDHAASTLVAIRPELEIH